MYSEKVCEQCGKKYIPKRYKQRFCSEKCKYTHENNKRKPYRDEYQASHREDIALKTNMLNLAYKFEIFRLLGNKCSKCGKENWKVLQIDHINGGGTRERKLKGCKKGNTLYREILKQIRNEDKKYQLMCADCNWEKRYDNPEERGRKIFNIPDINQLWKALQEGKESITWNGREFKFFSWSKTKAKD
jgi:hypothetical protein